MVGMVPRHTSLACIHLMSFMCRHMCKSETPTSMTTFHDHFQGTCYVPTINSPTTSGAAFDGQRCLLTQSWSAGSCDCGVCCRTQHRNYTHSAEHAVKVRATSGTWRLDIWMRRTAWVAGATPAEVVWIPALQYAIRGGVTVHKCMSSSIGSRFMEDWLMLQGNDHCWCDC